MSEIPETKNKKKNLFLDSKISSLENLELLFQKNLFKKEKVNYETLSDYLTSNYPYFQYIKNSGGNEKLNQLIEVLNFEVYEKNQTIINYGDECNKFFILLNGLIGIYKPKPKIVYITLREYIEYLSKVKLLEKNNSKVERIMSQNSEIDNFEIKKRNFDYRDYQEKRKLKITLEEDFKIGDFESNFTFGEISIIKKEPIEQTIIALKKTIILTIDKIDYNRLLRDIEENRISEKVNKFKKEFPFFSFWPRYRCLKLFNSFQKKILLKNEYLFKQNSKPDGIFLIKKGKFEISTFINFSWLESFIEYIYNSNYSIINDLLKLKYIPPNMMKKYINDNIKKNEKFTFNITNQIKNKTIEYDDINDIYDCNNLEKYSFKFIIKTINSPELIGYEECLDFKQRFYSVKCISETAEFYKISIDDFFQILPTEQKSEFFLQENLFEKKMYLISQIKNNILKKLNYIDQEKRENIMKLIQNEKSVKPIKQIKFKKLKNNLNKSESHKFSKLNKLPNLKGSFEKNKKFSVKTNLSFHEKKKNFLPKTKIQNLFSDNFNIKRKLHRNNSQNINLNLSKNIFLKSSFPCNKNIKQFLLDLKCHNILLNKNNHLMNNNIFNFDSGKKVSDNNLKFNIFSYK